MLQPQAEKPQLSQEVLDKLMEFSTAPEPAAVPQAITYNISDFTFGKVHAPSLAKAIKESQLGPKASNISVCNDTCRIDFADTLSGIEMQLLNKIICAHPGDGSPGEPVNISDFVKPMPDGAIKYLPAGGGLYGSDLSKNGVMTTQKQTEVRYSISADFPEGKVDDSVLIQAIAATIDTPVNYVETTPQQDACTIGFSHGLSPEERKLLNGIVANHQRLPHSESAIRNNRVSYYPEPEPEEPPDQFSLVRSLVADGVFKKTDEE